jgi:outer membrane protein OmpA-like peptidoglycan-associated protein
MDYRFYLSGFRYKALALGGALLFTAVVADCVYARHAAAASLDSLTENLNSRWDEQNPVLHPDGRTIYFTRANDSSNVGGPADKGDIWYAEMDANGQWGKPRHAGNVLNSALHNSMLGFSPDGNIMFLHLIRELPGGLLVLDGVGYSVRRGEAWSVIRKAPMDFYLNRSQHQSGSISKDGSVMVLSMESYASRGEEDIYVCFYKEGRWTQPVNLGDDINTAGQEMTPYLAADNRTLYFSSNGHGGQGGRDLFEATRRDDTWKSWSRPKNLGPEINSEGVELSYCIDYDKEMAYCTSTRNSDGYGDIRAVSISGIEPSDVAEVDYEALVVEQPSPTPLAQAAMRGVVVNAKDDTPLAAAISIRWDEEERYFTTNSTTGSFEAVLPDDAGKISISVKAPGFMAVEESIDPATVEGTLRFELTPLEKGTVFTLNQVYFERGKAVLLDSSFAELDRVAEVLQENPEIKVELSGHTDNQGSAKLNLQLSKDRVEVVKNYLADKGVDKGRIKGKGYGGTRPVASNASERTRKLNRRVEFKILEGAKTK